MSNQHVSYTVDTVSALAIVGAFAGLLPPLAALGALIWYTIQIWESKTVQGWITKRRHHRAKRRHISS